MKGDAASSRSDRCIHSLDCSDVFTVLHQCQVVCTNMCEVWCCELNVCVSLKSYTLKPPPI